MEKEENKRNRNKEILASFFFHFLSNFTLPRDGFEIFKKKNEKLNYIVRIDIETRSLNWGEETSRRFLED